MQTEKKKLSVNENEMKAQRKQYLKESIFQFESICDHITRICKYIRHFVEELGNSWPLIGRNISWSQFDWCSSASSS